MRILIFLSLFVVLILGADLSGPWYIELDDKNEKGSCAPWKDEIQEAYDQASQFASAAMGDIEFVKQNRPPESDVVERARWDRIARHLLVFFGFAPPEDDPGSSQHLQDIEFVFKRMHETLGGSANVPPKGMTGKFDKPAIACGGEWRLLGANTPDPTDPRGRKLNKSPQKKGKFPNGAWYWNGRFLSKGRGEWPCDDPDTEGITFPNMDVILLCLKEDEDKEPFPIIDEDEFFEGWTDFDDDFSSSLSTILVHEFAHYYGTKGDPNNPDWPNDPGDRNVIDQQAVDGDGNLLFLKEGKEVIQPPEDPQNKKKWVLTYHFNYVIQLARSHKGPNSGNAGPDKSVNTADAYAYFAITSFFKKWDVTDPPGTMMKAKYNDQED